jgi:glycerol-3-phosphate acyltransferase PlsY
MMSVFLYLAVIAIGYLLGSIPFGLLISRLLAKKDVRQVGSGKIGMTNVLRTAGKKAAALSLILDVLKGSAAVAIAAVIFRHDKEMVGLFTPLESAKVLAALAALAGHVWPVFLKFKGGRGVATFFGGLAGLYWPAAAVGGACTLGIGISTKYMSLGSIIGAVIAFILIMTLNILRINFLGHYPPFEYVVFSMIGSVFIYIMHRDNISRLFAGTERRIGEKGKRKPTTSIGSDQ